MKHFAVIGNPISHSRSPEIHELFAQSFGFEICYDKITATRETFPEVISELKERGYKGCNITLPFKEDAFALANEVSDRAKLAGAVNTLSFHADYIRADNTDGQGLVEDLTRVIGSLYNKRVLLIGAGGAARGCIYPLLKAKVESIALFNRSHDKAVALEQHFKTFGPVKAIHKAHTVEYAADIIINSTSSSVSNQLPDLSKRAFERACLAYDMYYQKDATVFERFAQDSNKRINTCDGLGMLVGQAAESFRIWHNVKPDITSTIELLSSSR